MIIIDKKRLNFKWKSTLKKVIIEDKCSILHKERKVKEVRCIFLVLLCCIFLSFRLVRKKDEFYNTRRSLCIFKNRLFHVLSNFKFYESFHRLLTT